MSSNIQKHHMSNQKRKINSFNHSCCFEKGRLMSEDKTVKQGNSFYISTDYEMMMWTTGGGGTRERKTGIKHT